jgi:ABC-type dipeptide/oligopeptide/nickel transport system permease subunit
LASRGFGTILGALAGYYGGWIDRLVSGYVFNVFSRFPDCYWQSRWWPFWEPD